jgi:hypothetical protein
MRCSNQQYCSDCCPVHARRRSSGKKKGKTTQTKEEAVDLALTTKCWSLTHTPRFCILEHPLISNLRGNGGTSSRNSSGRNMSGRSASGRSMSGAIDDSVLSYRADSMG